MAKNALFARYSTLPENGFAVIDYPHSRIPLISPCRKAPIRFCR